MQRFFFNFASERDYIPDDRGRELAGLAAAHRQAMLLINKLVLSGDLEWRGWSIRVTNENNRSVLSVLFPQAGRPLFTDTTVRWERQRPG